MSDLILCVDDEEDLLELLELNLNAALGEKGFEVVGCLNTEMAWRFIQKERIALILLDRTLNDGDGLYFAKKIKDAGYDMPIIFLSAKGLPDDRISGLKYADDYIAKPFNFDEVVARIVAVLRRYKKDSEQRIIKYKDIALNLDTKELCIDDIEIGLSPLEARVMQCFIQNGGKILTRNVLLQEAWSNEAEYHENSVNVAIKRLRKKIEKETKDIKIKSVRGEGYKLC